MPGGLRLEHERLPLGGLPMNRADARVTHGTPEIEPGAREMVTRSIRAGLGGAVSPVREQTPIPRSRAGGWKIRARR